MPYLKQDQHAKGRPMAISLALPPTSGTRDMVDVVLEEQHVPADLRGLTVIVRGEKVEEGSASFADELVRILVYRHAQKVVLDKLPPGLAKQMREAAKLRRFSGIS
jgi:hypothetical protein